MTQLLTFSSKICSKNVFRMMKWNFEIRTIPIFISYLEIVSLAATVNCPGHIVQFAHQTSARLSSLMQDHLLQGWHVSLDYLPFYPCVNANASFMCKDRKKALTACKWLGYKAVLSNITTCPWTKNEMFVYGNWTAALPFWNSIISQNKVHWKGNVIWKRFLFVLAILTTRFIF